MTKRQRLSRRFFPIRSLVGRDLQTIWNFWALFAEMGRNNNHITACYLHKLCETFKRNSAKNQKFKEGSVLQQCEFVNKVLFHGAFLFR